MLSTRVRRAAGGVLGGMALGLRALTTPVAAQEADRAAPTLPPVTVTAPARRVRCSAASRGAFERC